MSSVQLRAVFRHGAPGSQSRGRGIRVRGRWSLYIWRYCTELDDPLFTLTGAGLAQTIIDAEVLAECLAQDPINGLSDYEHQRIPVTATIVGAYRER